jgi:hypothetical protein
MKLLDFWPFTPGLKYPGFKEAIGPHDLIESGDGGIDPLLNDIAHHAPACSHR